MRQEHEHIAEPIRGLAVEVASLTPDPANARKHGDRNLAAIRSSLAMFGQRKPIVVQREGMVVRAGNGTVEAAKALGWTHVAAVILDDDNATASQFAIADNRTGELAEWNNEALASLLDGMDKSTREALAFDDREVDELMRSLEPLGDVVEDDIPEPPTDPVTKKGDLIVLGRHRVICGDATDSGTVRRLLGDDRVDCVLTDPPYCSGGFQESSRSTGSLPSSMVKVGKRIANDRLSTRGFQALLKSVINNLDAAFLYSFTDWRMWSWLFDVVEPSGYVVRSMIAWNKETPGMGLGWRSQHELIMWAAKGKVGWTNKDPGHGNVISMPRSKNELHATEKPVAVIAKLIEVASFCANFADPFSGSGTTLIAAEQLGRRCFGVEIDPAYCDVIVQRWENLTGQKAERHGQTG